ncbi:MAG: hypothetical protein ACFFCS_21150 [Candidatus Hodarchaeota archaeon]
MSADERGIPDKEQEESIKEALKDTMVKVNAMSNIIADNVINIGNLSKRAQAIVDEILELRETYKGLVVKYNETEYILNLAMVEEPTKSKKHDKIYKKLSGLRDERLKIIQHLKDHEQEIAAVEVSKEGSGQAHDLLQKEYNRLVKKMNNAKKNFPELYKEIRHQIAKDADKAH